MQASNIINVDVFVAGLGPAGASAACAAASAGYRVLAVDRKQLAGLPVQCAEFVPTMLSPTSSAVVAASCQRIQAMHTFVEDESPDLKNNFSGLMLDRAKFDQNLVSDAVAAGAHCTFDTSVKHIAQNGTVTLSDQRRIRPAVLIGADGPRSLVGRAVDKVNEHIVYSRQITVELRRPHNATDIFLSSEIPGGYAWLFPRGELANVGIGVVPQAKKNLRAALQALHSSLQRDGRVGEAILNRTGGAIPVGGMLGPIGDLGECHVFLVGDAAGLTNPISGAGISAAVLSGRLAGESAAAHLRGEAADVEYREELECLFGASLRRARARREELQTYYQHGRYPSPQNLRDTWIAYPTYWAREASAPSTRGNISYQRN